MAPRVRFAPSPTGTLHLGNARTALVNWLAARADGGTLVLRIEDTDVKRNRPGAEEALLADLAWLGLDWDEGPDVGGSSGPYRQSERARRYEDVVASLLASGAAYYCFCGGHEASSAGAGDTDGVGTTYRYPGTCRSIEPGHARRRVVAGEAAAVRFRVPVGAVHFEDGLRGRTGVAESEIGDFVVLRADGRPTYQLAVVVDDHDMAIDHVIRGQDHLSNTPRQVLLYQALAWPVPRFTHLPLVLGDDRRRLSKRHGASSVAEMRRRGIVPEALFNYLALLGWAPPSGAEALSRAEILREFDLAALSAVNAVFDEAKLEWLNQQHLGRFGGARLYEVSAPFLVEAGYPAPATAPQQDWWQQVLGLLCPTLRRLEELPAALGGLFRPHGRLEEEVDSVAVAALEAFRMASEAGTLSSPESFRETSRRISAETGARGRALFHPLRVALTGAEAGPELARLVPLIELGAGLELTPAVPGVAARLVAALGSS